MLVNSNTGEVLDADIRSKPRRAISQMYNTDWAVLHLSAEMTLAEDREITGETWRVLACLRAHLQPGNVARLRQADICQALHMPSSSVSRAIRQLLDKGVIHRLKIAPGWRIDPNYGWKGDPSRHVARQADGKLVFIGAER